jgi:hypothetical protein
MSSRRDRRDVPDELDRLLGQALHAAIRDVQPPAHLARAVRAAVARPQPEPQVSMLRTLFRALVAYLALDEEHRPVPMMVYTISFADVGSLSPGLGWSWGFNRSGAATWEGAPAPGRRWSRRAN